MAIGRQVITMCEKKIPAKNAYLKDASTLDGE
jgi:hypothetical protein